MQVFQATLTVKYPLTAQGHMKLTDQSICMYILAGARRSGSGICRMKGHS